jgi:hypothetical protein
MEYEHFDVLTRAVAAGETRRGALRLLAGGVFGIVATGIGAANGTQAGRKRGKGKRQRRRAPEARCGPLRPLCDLGEEHVCERNPATGKYEWHCRTCGPGQVSCNGHCEPRCSNGCELDPDQACLCVQPPPGKEYCPGKDRCVSTVCPPDRFFRPDICVCACNEVRPCNPGWAFDVVSCSCVSCGPEGCYPD